MLDLLGVLQHPRLQNHLRSDESEVTGARTQRRINAAAFSHRGKIKSIKYELPRGGRALIIRALRSTPA